MTCASSSSTGVDYAYPTPGDPRDRTRCGSVRRRTHAPASRPTGSPSSPRARSAGSRIPYGNHVARVAFRAGRAASTSLDILVELTVDVRPVNPFDFFLDERRRAPALRLPRRSWRASSRRSSRDDDPAFARGERFAAFDAELPRERRHRRRSSSQLNRGGQPARPLRHPRGAGRLDAGGDAAPRGAASCRDSAVLLAALLRARGLAARFVSRLPRPAHRRGDDPRPAARRRPRRGRSARLGRGVPAGRRAGSGSTRPAGCSAARGTSRSPAPRRRPLAAPLEGTSDARAERGLVRDDASAASATSRARPRPSPTRCGRSSLAAGDARGRARSRRRGVALTIGGEPTFNSREHAERARVERRGARPDQVGRRACALAARAPPAARARRGRARTGRASTTRARACRAGRSSSSAGATARRSGRATRGRRGRRSPTRRALRRARSPRASASPTGSCAGVRGSLAPPRRTRPACPSSVDPRRAELDDPEERRRLARVLDRGLGARGRLRAARSRAPATAAGAASAGRSAAAHLFLAPRRQPDRPPPAARARSAPAPPPPPSRRSRRRPARSAPRRPASAAQARRAPRPRPAAAAPGAHRALRRGARRRPLRLPPAAAERRATSSTLVAAVDAARAELGARRPARGLPAAALARRAPRSRSRPTPACSRSTSRRRARSRELRRARSATVFDAALHAGLHAEKYLARRAHGRQRRRPPPHARRPDAAREPVRAPARPAREPASRSPSTTRRSRTSSPGLFVGPDLAGAARRRGAPRRALRARDRARARLRAAAPSRRRRGSRTRSSATCSSTSPATPTAPSSASTSCSTRRPPHGRQGLVELRAFEMPPHPRMAVAQVLLVRALVAAFAPTPYRAPLVRWGQALHDRFLLPHWLWRDFEDVLAYLAARGLAAPRRGLPPLPRAALPARRHARRPAT